MNMRRQILKAFFNGIKARKSAEHGEMRRPDVRGNKDGVRGGLQSDFQ